MSSAPISGEFFEMAAGRLDARAVGRHRRRAENKKPLHYEFEGIEYENHISLLGLPGLGGRSNRGGATPTSGRSNRGVLDLPPGLDLGWVWESFQTWIFLAG